MKKSKTDWLLNSGNYVPDRNGIKIIPDQPGSHYGMVLLEKRFFKQ
jgi:hypothetical protein